MPRILVEQDWYEPLSSRSVLESEYEASVLRYAPELFPGYTCHRFNTRVHSDDGAAHADLVLIDQRFRGWTIVEVELEHHPLMNHVEPQMRRLVSGRYTASHIDFLLNHNPNLDRDRTASLIRAVAPDFAVIVPEENSEWRSTLNNLGVKMCVVKIFENYRGRRLVVQSGDTIRAWDEGEVSRLTRGEFLPRSFRVETPSALPPSDTLTLKYQGFLTSWRVVRAQMATYILPNRSFDVGEGKAFILKQSKSGTLEIEAI
jgi:hypothetical protein